MKSRTRCWGSRCSWYLDCAPGRWSRCSSSARRRSAGRGRRWASGVSASSWLCSAITPAPQQAARSSSMSSMLSSGATLAIEPSSSSCLPRHAARPVGDLHDVPLLLESDWDGTPDPPLRPWRRRAAPGRPRAAHVQVELHARGAVVHLLVDPLHRIEDQAWRSCGPASRSDVDLPAQDGWVIGAQRLEQHARGRGVELAEPRIRRRRSGGAARPRAAGRSHARA